MLRRLVNVIKGFFGLAISEVEKNNPEALLEVEKENLRKQIANYNQGLAAHAGLCEKLITQVKKLESEELDLKAKVTAHLRATNRDAAGQYALRLQTVTRELEQNRSQLADAESTYKQLTAARDSAIQAAKAKIESLKTSLNDLKIKRATAELGEMAAGMITEIGGSGDTLNRLHEMVEEEREKAAGRARVARDAIPASDADLKEGEQQALADLALADFAAANGITLDAPTSTPTPQSPTPEPETQPKKSMGPQATE